MGAGYPSQRMLYFSLEDLNFLSNTSLYSPLHANADKPAVVKYGVCFYLLERLSSPQARMFPKGRLPFYARKWAEKL